jgi:curved DNA-binding protein CbpA
MNLSSKYNYYEVLEINQQAAQHEVSTAYDRAKSTYSTENPALYTIFSDAEAREWLTLIEEAYSVLGNKALRSIYDERMAASVTGNLGREELRYDSLLHASKQVFPEPQKKQPVVASPKKISAEMEEKIKSTTEWTGALLKEVREYKGFSLEKLSEITKVTSFYLNSVEKEDPKNLPAQVFVRGYVVQIAKTLGLDQKIVADSYMKRFKANIGN